MTDISDFMSCADMQRFEQLFAPLVEQVSVQELRAVMQQLAALGYDTYIRFCPSLMRGFDYYDGIVFEVFDLHPDNNRALF